MLKRGKMDRDVVEIVGIDSLVPKEHLLRKIDKAVDFNRLYEMVEPLYCEDNGRPSVDPVVLFKMVLIQHLYDDVHSDTEDRYITIGEINGVAIIVFVVYTERDDAIRLISARKATKQERRAYYDYS